MTHQAIIHATQNWLYTFIIAYNICPFARRVVEQNKLRYHIVASESLEQVLRELISECRYLDTNPETETTLIILPKGFDDFDDYLDMLALAEQLLVEQDYEGIYQLASFHPDYCFAETSKNTDDDPANYTNRSPYPMLHIIREASIEAAIQRYTQPENIPNQNIKLTRALGASKLQMLLAACYLR